MKKKLKCFFPSALATLTCLALQIHLSQAMDTSEIIELPYPNNSRINVSQTNPYHGNISEQERRNVIELLNLQRAINITTTTSEVKIQDHHDAIKWEGQPQWIKPNETFNTCTELTFSQQQQQFKKLRILDLDTNIDVHCLGAEAHAGFEKTSKTSKEKKKAIIYLLATHDVPSIIVSIDKRSIKMKSEFKEEIETAMTTINDLEKYQKLIHVFYTRGFYVPTKYYLGGYIWTEKVKTVRNEVEAQKAKNAFDLAVTTAILGHSNSAKGDYHSEISSTETSSEIQHHINLKLIGGDRNKRDNIKEWVTSLDDPNQWSVIRYENVLSIFDILECTEPTLVNNCELLIKQFYNSYERRNSSLDALQNSYRSHFELPRIIPIRNNLISIMKPAIEKLRKTGCTYNEIKDQLTNISNSYNIYLETINNCIGNDAKLLRNERDWAIQSLEYVRQHSPIGNGIIPWSVRLTWGSVSNCIDSDWLDYKLIAILQKIQMRMESDNLQNKPATI